MVYGINFNGQTPEKSCLDVRITILEINPSIPGLCCCRQILIQKMWHPSSFTFSFLGGLKMEGVDVENYLVGFAVFCVQIAAIGA